MRNVGNAEELVVKLITIIGQGLVKDATITE